MLGVLALLDAIHSRRLKRQQIRRWIEGGAKNVVVEIAGVTNAFVTRVIILQWSEGLSK
jgi:hypothetical protein